MASPLEQLQGAGFSDDEIATWSTERRDALTTAGFKENEIDAYFTGGVVAPDTVPEPFVRRVELGQRISEIWGAVTKEMAHGWGDSTPTGIPDKQFNELIELGVFHDPAKGKPGPVQFMNEAIGIPLAQTIGGVFRGISAGVHGAGALVGELHRGIIEYEQGQGRGQGVDAETEGNKAKRETINFANWAMIEGGMGRFNRPRHTPEGIIDEPIGGLPKSEDFVNSAKVLTDETAPRAVQEKLLKTYEERGVHPSEMAADAASDPVLKQRLLSKDPQDLPYTVWDQIGDSGYQFNVGKEPVLPKELQQSIDTLRDAGFDASSAELYFKDIFQKKPSATDPLLKTDAIEPLDGPKLFGDFEIKPMEAVKEQPAPREGTLASAQAEISEKISVGGKDAKRKLTLSRAYTETIDDLHPLKGVSESAYQQARLTRGQFGKAEYFLEHGTFDFNTFKDTGKPLKQILEPVRDDLGGLRNYLAAKRAMELEDAGKTSGFDFLAARQVVAETGKQYEKIAAELVDYQKETLKYLKDSGVLSEDAYTAMLDANKNYVPFFRVMGNEIGVGGKGASSSLGPGNPVKMLKGSQRDIIDPIESIIKNTYAYISIAERNQAGMTLIDALKKQGEKVEVKRAPKPEGELVDYLKEQGVTDPAAIAEFVQTAAQADGAVLRAFRDGVRHEVKVADPELVVAYQGLDRASAGMLTKVFAVPARAMRGGAVLTPDFIARNAIRDLMTAFVNSKGLFSPVDTLKGLTSVLRKDEAWGDWVKSGGANSTMVALDRAYLQESLTKLAGETGLMDRAWNVIKHPIADGLRPLRFLSETIENATRVGEFRKLSTGDAAKGEMQSAAFASREVTLDFARMGAQMRGYNMVTAFANAQIQGIDRIARGFADRPVNTVMKIAGGITLPSILLWFANHGDKRVEELPHWQKDLFWIIATNKWEPISPADAGSKPEHLIRTVNGRTEFNNGSIYRIPKPFELGVIFGSGVERILDATIGNDKEAFDGFTKSVIEVLTPSFIPTAIQPGIEQFANRSTFIDRTLIPADMEKHLPEYQYTPYTTQLSRKLGQVVAAFPGMREASVDPGNKAGPVARAATSPILIENYVRSWTGGLGVYMMQATDLGLRKAGVLPDPVTPTPTLADIPFVKAFVARYPSAGMQPIQDFYDEHKKQEAFFKTWMARAQEGDVEAMERIQEAGGPQMFVRLDAFKEALSGHSKVIRDIYKDKDMPADEKRQLIDGLYYNMINIGRTGRDIQRAVKTDQAPR